MSRPKDAWSNERRGGSSIALMAAVLGVIVAVVAVGVIDAVAGVWPPWAEEETREPVYPDVTATVEWLAGRLGTHDPVVVDARPRDAYLDGHLPTAVSVPAFGETDPQRVADLLAGRGLDGRGRIVCYGDDPYSADAATLFWLMELAGAARVSILDGGVAGWLEAGHELEVDERTLPAVDWGPEPNPDLLATAAYVGLKFGEPGFEIIDARDWTAWEGPLEEHHGRGHAPEAPPRTGHIPHALPLDYREFILPDGQLIPAEDARQILAAFGPRPSTPVDLWDEFIVYDDGVSGEGAIGYFLLRRAGVGQVRYYPGGWEEWARDVSLPVVRIIHAEELERRLAEGRSWFRPSAPPAGFAVFDVRHWTDFERGHIPGAASLTSRFFADSLDVYLERHWPDLDRRTAPIVTYCYGSNCIRSRNCATVAARQGFVNVERFYGGIEEWRSIGGGIVSGP